MVITSDLANSDALDKGNEPFDEAIFKQTVT